MAGTLRFLDVSSTALAGSVPRWLGECARLTELRLDHCGFSGAIPMALGDCGSLKLLRLDGNGGKLTMSPSDKKELSRRLPATDIRGLPWSLFGSM